MICRAKIHSLDNVSEEERDKALTQLMHEYQEQRHQALQAGASGFGDPSWASAAACEGWIHVQSMGEDDERVAYSLMCNELIDRE